MMNYPKIIGIKYNILALIPFGEFELFFRLIMYSFDGDESEARDITSFGPEEKFLIELMDLLQLELSM